MKRVFFIALILILGMNKYSARSQNVSEEVIERYNTGEKKLLLYIEVKG